MDKKRVVVCGATGKQGGAVVRSVLAGGRWDLAAISRTPEGPAAVELKHLGVQVLRGDLLDKGSLIDAFRGAYGVYGVTQPWSPDYKKCNIADEIQQGKNIIDACLDAGVRHLVLSSVLLPANKKMGVPHVDSKVDIEAYGEEKKAPLTIVRPGSFMDNIGSSYFPVRQGKVRGFVAGDAKVPYIACMDIGVLVSVVFERPAEFMGRVVNAVGDYVSGFEIAGILSRLRNGERFSYSVVPAPLMWLFAREFYTMRRAFEKHGRPPYPAEIACYMEETRRMHPGAATMEEFLRRQGYASRALR